MAASAGAAASASEAASAGAAASDDDDEPEALICGDSVVHRASNEAGTVIHVEGAKVRVKRVKNGVNWNLQAASNFQWVAQVCVYVCVCVCVRVDYKVQK